MRYKSLILLVLVLAVEMSAAMNELIVNIRPAVHKPRAVDLQTICDGQRYGALVANPNDCSSFYVCQFIVHLAFCSDGLHFDRRKRVCNWPRFAGCDWVDTEDNSSSELLSGEHTDASETDEILSAEKDNNQQSPRPIEESKEEEHTKLSSVPPTEDDLNAEKEDQEKPISWRPTLGSLPTTEEVIFSSLVPTEEDVVTTEEDPGTTTTFRQPTVSDLITDPEAELGKPGSQEPSVEDVITTQKDQGDGSTPKLEAEDPITMEEVEDNTSSLLPTTDDGITDEWDQSSRVPPLEDLVTAKQDQSNQIEGFVGSQYSNLSASILSVESANDIIDRPIVGAHSSETGYPIDVMTGYDPKHVQCIHNGLYFLPHPSNCEKYFICAYRHLHSHSCGSGVSWNHELERCELKGQAKCYSREVSEENTTERITPPSIEEETTIPSSTRKPLVRTTRIPTKTTSHPHWLPLCPSTHQAYLPNLDDCHKYFICIMGKAVLTSCPSGMHWDAIGEFCGKPSVVRCAFRWSTTK